MNVSPNEDTVWLSKEQIALLFGRDRSVISRHINKIYGEGELDKESTCAKNARMPETGNRLYESELYSLDVIISVGYRVKSRNGIVFRKWASKVLKEYLIRGYVVDKNRTLVTNENYINLINRVESIDTRLSKIESEYTLDLEKVFFEGEYLNARTLIKELVSKAKATLVVIDPYADAKALDFLSSKENGVPVTLLVSSKTRLTQGDVDAFNLQYGGLAVKVDDSFHDRFIVVDSAILYCLGASLNYAGKKTFAIIKVNDDPFITDVMHKIHAD